MVRKIAVGILILVAVIGAAFVYMEGRSVGEKQTTASGLQYVIHEQGAGERPVAGDTVSVHYTGTLENGTKFDSSRDRGQPFTFRLGMGQVIAGWDEGIALLNEGGTATLTVPPGLGYGAQGYPPVIPPNSTLIFEVELVDVQKP